MGDVKITIKTGSERHETNYFQQASPVPMPVPVQPAEAQPAAPVASEPAATEEKGGEDTSKYIEIKSPIIGTVYRKTISR